MTGAALTGALVTTALTLPPTANASANPPAFVQVASATPPTPQSSVSVTFANAEAAGNANIVAIGWTDTAASIANVTDSAGNTYAVAVATFRGNGLSQAIYYAGDLRGGADTVTVTFDRAASYVDLRVSEYSGVGGFDVGASATGGTGNGDSGTVTTTNANDLLFGAGMSGGAFSTAGSGYTSRVLTPNGDITEDRVVTATGTYDATAGNTGPWLMQLAAFKADGSASPSPTAASPSPTTATPSPTPTAASPSPTTGWPNATNTGVPAGTTLTSYTGPCTITTPGTVIDAKTIDCDVVVQAAGVSITRSKVNGQIALDTDNPSSSGWSITVTDSEVDPGVVQYAAICCGNMTLRRVNSHGGVTSVQCEEKSTHCKVTDSWLHGQGLPENAVWHLGGFLSDGTLGAGCSGTWCIELDHNTVVCDHPVNNVQEGCTGDINLIPNFATISKVRVHNNYLGANTGSAFCTYGGERPDSPYPHADHVTYQDNVFQHGTNRLCAAYGPVNAFNVDGTGNVWINNTWDDDGTVVPPVN